MKQQLRPFHDPSTLSQIYHQCYDHTRWADHIERVKWTIDHGATFVRDTGAVTLVDLSCGDGAILKGIERATIHEVSLTYGDIVGAEHLDMIGPIELTLAQSFLPSHRKDLLVMTETLEHLTDPEKTLAMARTRFEGLIVSTPIDETVETHDNVEHYWSWGVADVFAMLDASGWTPYRFARMDTAWYNYQLWCCK